MKMTGRKIDIRALQESLNRLIEELPKHKRPKTDRELVRILRVRILEQEANIAASKQIQEDEMEYFSRVIHLAMSNPSTTLAEILKDLKVRALAAKLPRTSKRLCKDGSWRRVCKE